MNNTFTKITEPVKNAAAKLGHYKIVIFVILVLSVYGYIIVNISMLTNAQPSEESISELSSPIRSAKIDERVIKQLQQLQDNSVSVKALFDEARSNPFQEKPSI